MDILKIVNDIVPEGTLDKIAESVGIDKDTLSEVVENAAPQIASTISGKISKDKSFLDKAMGMVSDSSKKGIASAVLGSQSDIIAKMVSEKVGISEGITKNILDKAMPYILDAIKGGKISPEMLAALAGLSDGFDMKDVTNIASAVFGGGKKTSGGIMGMLGNLFGGKK